MFLHRKILARYKSFDNLIAMAIITRNLVIVQKFDKWKNNRFNYGCDICKALKPERCTLYNARKHELYFYTDYKNINNHHYQFCRKCKEELIVKINSFFYNFHLLEDQEIFGLGKDLTLYIKTIFINTYIKLLNITRNPDHIIKYINLQKEHRLMHDNINFKIALSKVIQFLKIDQKKNDIAEQLEIIKNSYVEFLDSLKLPNNFLTSKFSYMNQFIYLNGLLLNQLIDLAKMLQLKPVDISYIGYLNLIKSSYLHIMKYLS